MGTIFRPLYLLAQHAQHHAINAIWLALTALAVLQDITYQEILALFAIQAALTA